MPGRKRWDNNRFMVGTGSEDGGMDVPGGNGDDLVAALDMAPAGIVVTDPRRLGNPVVFANVEFTRITGYSLDELKGEPLRRLQGPATDPALVARLRAAVAAGRDESVELINYRKNGTPFLMRVDIRPIRDPAGTVVAFVGVLSDITEARRADEILRQSEERMRAVMEAVPLPMLVVRPGGVVVQANAAAHLALGVDVGAFAGRDIGAFAVSGGNGDAGLSGMVGQGTSPERRELRLRRADGRTLWALASAQRFHFRGETLNVLAFQDVTDLKRREEALTQANEEAEKNIRARMRFLAAASHDLRQPLQALALFASALDHHVQSPQGRTIVHSVKTALRGMEEMFDALMDMSKLDAGVMKAESRVFLLSDVFEQLESSYGPQAAAAGLALRVVASSATIRSDPRLLARILGNFLSNAIRYTRTGHILLGARRRNGELRISVCDTGPGIPESQRLEIFQEFRQGASVPAGGRNAGMGLGLAIAQRLARLLNHRLDVRSAVARGSCFSVWVPLAAEWKVAEPEPAAHEEPGEVAGAVIVVIDDDPDIRDGLDMILAEWGCLPVVAASAEGAVDQLAQKGLKPDLILADFRLPESGSGGGAIGLVRTRTGTEAPAFLFTGDTGVPAGSEAGEFRILRKPIDPVRLRAVLAEALRG